MVMDQPYKAHHCADRYSAAASVQLANRRGTNQHDSNAVVRRSSSSAVPSDMMPDGTRLFVLDTKGDTLISRYGVDKSKVPVYRRAGRGRILGSTGYLSVFYEGSQQMCAIQHSRGGDRPRTGRNSILAQAAHMTARPCRPKTNDLALGPSFDSAADFISMNPSRKRKRIGGQVNSDSQLAISSDDDTPNYRTIEGKAKVKKEEAENDSDYSSDVSAATAGAEVQLLLLEDPLVARNLELKRHLDNNVGDADAWLERVFLQDDVLKLRHGVAELSDPAKLGQAEIKIDMLRKALKHVTDPRKKLSLQTALISEGRKVWESAKLARQWKSIDGRDETLLLLRMRLDSQLPNREHFQFQIVFNIFIEMMEPIKTRLQNQEGDVISHCEKILYLFLRATRFVFDAGYTELAVALWQALLELHFCRPHELMAAADGNVLEQFKGFWESEAPRMGEPDARGWLDSTKTSSSTCCAVVGSAMEESTIGSPLGHHPFSLWATQERQRSLVSLHPTKIKELDESPDYDPFNLVLFDDLLSMLFVVPSVALVDFRKQLIDAFLMFSGLPPAFGDSDVIREALHDSRLVSKVDRLDEALLAAEKVTSVLEPQDPQRKTPIFASARACSAGFVPHLPVLFPGHDWFPYLPPSRDSQETWAVDPAWSARVVSQLVCQHQVEELAAYFLAMECARSPETIRRTAKKVLRIYQGNLVLYIAYALAENALGNTAAANAVFESASKLARQHKDSLALYYHWAWTRLREDKPTDAVLCLCQGAYTVANLPIPNSPSPATILKARQLLLPLRFDSDKDEELAHVTCFSSLMLLDYLTVHSIGSSKSQNNNLDAAVHAMEMFVPCIVQPSLSGTNFARERQDQLCLQEFCQLLYYHSTTWPHRPAAIREAASRLARAFPGNTMFLSMFEWAEGPAALLNPARGDIVTAILEDETFRERRPDMTRTDSPAARVFAIRHASLRSPYAVRAAFEAALLPLSKGGTTSGCEASVGLWRCYFTFLVRSKGFRRLQRRDKTGKGGRDGETRRNDYARDAFFRALAQCPGVKALAMDAFDVLQRHLESFEMENIVEEMVKWGVRISKEPVGKD